MNEYISPITIIQTKLNTELENKALRLLLKWAIECDFGYDNFPEEYECYKEDVEDMDYIEGMIYIAKKVIEEKQNELTN